MKYRTVIEILTDAEDKNEAIDIAGEFLRGNIESGVEMKCHAKPLKSHRFIQTSTLLLFVFLFIGIASFGYFKNADTPSLPAIKNTSAFQPPLKTSCAVNFRENWEDQENKKAIEYIKK